MPLEDCEQLLGALDERALLHIHPNNADDEGGPRSIAFAPTGAREGSLSVARESVIQPGAFFEVHERDTVGIAAIPLQAVMEAGFRVIDDSDCEDVPDHHAYVDMRHLTPKQIERQGKKLKQVFIEHGELIAAPAEGADQRSA